jgi:ribosomal protein S18 acetylase RimI-like enzyme
MKISFKHLDWFMELDTPDYETRNFGLVVGELRLANETFGIGNSYDPNLLDVLLGNKISICTFRGKEDTKLISYLNSLGFKFIGSFYTLKLDKDDFVETSLINPELTVVEATGDDFERMYEIERDVFDYSSYQMDDRLPKDMTADRNVKRVEAYVTKPNHHAFLVKKGDVTLGFIQFLYDKGVAYAVNGAIDKEHHQQFMGTIMYSGAFRKIFDSGMTTILSGVSVQNVRALKIHQACGFKITDSEIHLRWIEK